MRQTQTFDNTFIGMCLPKSSETSLKNSPRILAKLCETMRCINFGLKENLHSGNMITKWNTFVEIT